MRSKSHIRSELTGGNPVAGESIANLNYAPHQSSQKKQAIHQINNNSSNNNHYSPCPKIPSAIDNQ